MALPRSMEDANKQMRNAAVEKLRSEFGILLARGTRTAAGIARKIREIEPGLRSDDPMMIVRAWVNYRASSTTPSALITSTGRQYTPDAAMRLAASRAASHPRLISMSSNVLYAPEGDR